MPHTVTGLTLIFLAVLSPAPRRLRVSKASAPASAGFTA